MPTWLESTASETRSPALGVLRDDRARLWLGRRRDPDDRKARRRRLDPGVRRCQREVDRVRPSECVALFDRGAKRALRHEEHVDDDERTCRARTVSVDEIAGVRRGVHGEDRRIRDVAGHEEEHRSRSAPVPLQQGGESTSVERSGVGHTLRIHARRPEMGSIMRVPKRRGSRNGSGASVGVGA